MYCKSCCFKRQIYRPHFIASLGVLVYLLCPIVLSSCNTSVKPVEQWEQIFNGKDLSGWQIKISGYALNDNYKNTFSAKDGYLRVSYDGYEEFNNRFGHIFYKEKLSHFKLNLDYRFYGQQVAGAPDWAYKNSGVKFHSQAPVDIPRDQQLLVAVEAQILGGRGEEARPTGNVCTAGTHIEMKGKLITQHCTSSNSQTFSDNQWVNLELEVRGNDKVVHRINGKTVLEYSRPQLDEQDEFAQELLSRGVPRMLSDGFIALQAESHPIEFRNIRLMRLAN